MVKGVRTGSCRNLKVPWYVAAAIARLVVCYLTSVILNMEKSETSRPCHAGIRVY